MRRLLVLTTGGTIASKYDDALGGYTTMVEGADLVAAVPGLGDLATVEVMELANLSSTYLTPAMVFGWAQRVSRELEADDVAGAVVTHGTDTLEESAFLFDTLLTTPKPVVFTGAMRTGSDLVIDGPRNLLSAARVALHDDARDRGVLVVLNDEVHAARDVTKTSSEGLESFGSPTWGPVALVSRDSGGDVVTFRGTPYRSPTVPTERIEERVAYVTTVLGSDGSLIDAAVDMGARGVVIEAFGGGEITPFMTDAVLRARDRGVVVLVATRSSKGRPLDLYADLGEGRWLRDHGVLFSGYLSGPKARIALMLALGTDDESTATRYFE